MSDVQKTLHDLIDEVQIGINIIKECIRIGHKKIILHNSFTLSLPLKLNLSATDYYEIFLLIFDGLNLVEEYFLQCPQESLLYDESQFFPEILPRLYTSITVGAVLYRQSHDSFYLSDMLDMIKGVQHPLRGLFLRYYLNKKIKDQLQENCLDSIRFVLCNLSSMNTLWSRITSPEERQKLKLTVGENIERLSVLCSDKSIYLDEIFPSIEEILRSSDLDSQQYLLDCIVQAFPDEFHMHTLNSFLKMACDMQASADAIDLVMRSLQRLLVYLQETNQRVNETAYPFMQDFLELISSVKTGNDLKKKVEVHFMMIRFSTSSIQGIEHAFHCLETCIQLESEGIMESESGILSDMLCFSLQLCVVRLINSPFANKIYCFLDEPNKVKFAHRMIEALNQETSFSVDVCFWKNIIWYIEILSGIDSLTETLLIIRILHKLNPENSEIFEIAIERFQQNELIMTAISFLCMKFASIHRSMHLLLFQVIRRIKNTRLALQIGINAIICFNNNKHTSSIPRMFDEIFQLYAKLEDNSKKVAILPSLIGCLLVIEGFEAPVDKISEICFKLPKKIEQCTILLLLTHIFHSKILQDSSKLLDILKRCVKLADLCMTGSKNLWLFVSILNNYIFFFLKEVPSIEASSIDSIIELIFELLSFQNDKGSEYNYAKTYLRNTIRSIESKQSQNKLTEINFNPNNLLTI